MLRVGPGGEPDRGLPAGAAGDERQGDRRSPCRRGRLHPDRRASAGCVGSSDVFAAGDGTNFPLKQGGIATQQADTAAAEDRRGARFRGRARAFRPVLRGKLLTGAESRAHADRRRAAARARASSPATTCGGRRTRSAAATWRPGSPGESLAHDELEPPARAIDVEVSVPHEWHAEPISASPHPAAVTTEPPSARTLTMLTHVPISPLPAERFRDVLGDDYGGSRTAIEDARSAARPSRDLARQLDRRGGRRGRAPALAARLRPRSRSRCPLERDRRRRPDSSRITKRIHNQLHGLGGDGGPLGVAERRLLPEGRGSQRRGARTSWSGPVTSSTCTIPQTAGMVGADGRGGGDRHLALPHRDRRAQRGDQRRPGRSCGR